MNNKLINNVRHVLPPGAVTTPGFSAGPTRAQEPTNPEDWETVDFGGAASAG